MLLGLAIDAAARSGEPPPTAATLAQELSDPLATLPQFLLQQDPVMVLQGRDSAA